MNVITVYVMTKEKLSREISEKVAELNMSGMSYKEALERAKKLISDINLINDDEC